MPDDGAGRTRPVVDARQLWAGGVATAVVAALIALVGVVVCRWLFNIPLLSPSRDGAYGDAHTTTVMLVAAAAALLATGLAHLLLVATPRPMSFFTWIVGLVTLLLVLFPFSTSAPLSQKIATAAVDLVIGIAIGSLHQRGRCPRHPAAAGSAPAGPAIPRRTGRTSTASGPRSRPAHPAGRIRETTRGAAGGRRTEHRRTYRTAGPRRPRAHRAVLPHRRGVPGRGRSRS